MQRWRTRRSAIDNQISQFDATIARVARACCANVLVTSNGVLFSNVYLNPNDPSPMNDCYAYQIGDFLRRPSSHCA